jgi:hypothetical protein
MEAIPKFLFRMPYVLYGKPSVHIEKWTGGGKSTLLLPDANFEEKKDQNMGAFYGRIDLFIDWI